MDIGTENSMLHLILLRLADIIKLLYHSPISLQVVSLNPILCVTESEMLFGS